MKVFKLFAFLGIILFASSVAMASVVEKIDENDPSKIGVSVTEIENRIKALMNFRTL